MNATQLAEVARIANIFGTWAAALKVRADHAKSLGYGIEDSWSQHISNELQGAVDALNNLPNLV